MDIVEMASPTCSPIDIRYEADCRAALAPIIGEMLDLPGAAGWNRRRVAYAAMMVAAQELRNGQKGEAQDSELP